MANLLASLRISAETLRTYESVLEATQNNVYNASTPGYSRQTRLPVAQPFNPDAGLAGGVSAGAPSSARSAFAERQVRRYVADEGRAKARAELLSGVEGAFPMGPGAGVAGALSRFFSSCSAWSLAPNDLNARQAVLVAAGGLARSFQDAAAALASASRETETRLGGTIERINSLAARLRDYNVEIRRGARNDAGLDARVHTALEELAELVDITVLPAADGSFTVLAGGEAPLVIGDRDYPLAAGYASAGAPPYPDGPRSARVLDATGRDVTAAISGGVLGGVLDVRNRVMAGLLGDGTQPGGLNRLARAVAERVNGLLQAGWTGDGAPPEAPLFVYGAAETAAAASIAVNPAFTPGMLAAIDPGPPYAGNGTALKLAALGAPDTPADGIDGASYIHFYGTLAGGAGRELAAARQDSGIASDLAVQARAVRQQISGVSLDEEAATLLQYQRAYQAAARLVTVLDELTEMAVNLLR